MDKMSFEEIKRKAVAQWEELQNRPKPRILVGMGTCGIAAGAEDILNTINQELSQNGIQGDVISVGCIGLCYAEPLVEVIKPGMPSVIYGNLTPGLMSEIIRDYLVNNNPRPDLAFATRGKRGFPEIPRLHDLPVFKPQVRIALRNCGNIDPSNINHYLANGGYEGLNNALKRDSQEVIDEIIK
jgi:NADH-quinone oxidoreductase subunit F